MIQNIPARALALCLLAVQVPVHAQPEALQAASGPRPRRPPHRR